MLDEFALAAGLFFLLSGLTGWLGIAALESAIVASRDDMTSVDEARRLGPLFLALYERPRQEMVRYAIARECLVAVSACGSVILGLAASNVTSAFLLLALVTVACATGRSWASCLAARKSKLMLRLLHRPGALLLRFLDQPASKIAHIGRQVYGVLRREMPSGDNLLAQDEISTLSGGTEAEGLESPDRTLLAKLRIFGDLPVRQIMTPRVDVFALPADTLPHKLRQELLENRFSRVPVYRQERENIVGILYMKDMVGRSFDSCELEEVLRKPYFVPTTKTAGELFREFRKSRVHMAVVVDEYGGMAGLVTMEDLLEELFGEIRDEFDETEEAILRSGPRAYTVSGRLPITDLRSRLNLRVQPEENEATVAGLIVARLGRVPEPGTVVPMDGFTLTVEAVEAHAVDKVRVDLWPLSSS